MSYKFLLTQTRGGGKRGFTLIEMLVVIGMITIVTAIALPSLKGIFEDFKFNQTIQEVDTIISSYRSYYLIMNEFPGDTTEAGYFPNTKADWCLPRNFYTASPHKFSVKPYKGNVFDFQQWTTAYVSGMRGFGAILLELNRISDAAALEKYKTKFSNLYPKVSLSIRMNNYLGIIFPEITKDCESEAGGHRNRYR